MFVNFITRLISGTGSPYPLAALRIWIALHSMVHALSTLPDMVNLYASQGYVRTAINEIFLWDITLWFTKLRYFINGPDELLYLSITWAGYLLTLLLLGLGKWTRLVSLASWFLHLLWLKSAYLVSYGSDYFTALGLFWCVVAPVSRVWSLDSRKRRPSCHSVAYYYQGLLQITLCCVYFFAGFSKTFGQDWWTGDAVWLVLHKAAFQSVNLDSFRHFDWAWQILGWLTLLLELGYVLAIWQKQIGAIWLLGILSLHAGIALFMHLPFFGSLLIGLNLCAFPNHLEVYKRWMSYIILALNFTRNTLPSS